MLPAIVEGHPGHMVYDFESYDISDAQALVRSPLKIRILLLLSDNPYTLAQIRDATGSSSQALIPRMKGLESQLLIEQKEYYYSLTPLGTVITLNIRNFIAATATIKRHNTFFAAHDTGAIPLPLLSGIGCLAHADLIQDRAGEVNQVYSLFLSIINEANHIHGVSSVMSPNMGECLAGRITAGIPAELVVTPEGAEKLREKPYIAFIEVLLNFPHFRVWVLREPVKIGLTVTDRCISLGLFKRGENVYDISSDLYSTDPGAIVWGEELFGFFRDASEPFSL